MQDWWRGSVTYQIYPRSFQDTDGDGVGDLPGITQRLEHAARLGVDAVWLSPVFTSPMDDMGYDVSDYTGIDPLFGTLEDFDRMVARAHELGLKVIIDQVLSHTSDRHPWFLESRASRENARGNWYVWADPKPDGSPPNNWPSVFGGSAWEWDARRRQYYLHNFLTTQPDLNFHEPEVQDALLEVLHFWLERGVDGFRFDTINYYFHDAKLRNNPPERRAEALPTVNPYDMQDHRRSKTQPENIAFLNRIRALLDSFDERASVGEIGEGPRRSVQIMADYTRGEDRLHMAYSFEMLGKPFGAPFFRSAVERFFRAAPDGWPCWSFSNHDVIRHVTRWSEHFQDRDAFARQMAALLLSLRGSVCLYQGEELGLGEADLAFSELTDPPGIRFWPEYKGRDGARTPMPWDGGNANSGFSTGKPWLPIKEDHASRNAAAQEADPGSVLAFYREMLAWRRTRRALRTGEMRFFPAKEPILAYERHGPDQAPVICVFNLSPAGGQAWVEGLRVIEDAPRAGASLTGDQLVLEPNGFAFLESDGSRKLRVRSAN